VIEDCRNATGKVMEDVKGIQIEMIAPAMTAQREIM